MRSSKMQVVFAQLMLLQKQNEELTTEIQLLYTHESKKITYLSSTMNRLLMISAKVPCVNFIDYSTNAFPSSLLHSQSIPGQD